VSDDGVVLSEREREALAGLAESIGDPWLARQLVGQDRQPERPKSGFPWSVLRRIKSPATSGWVGLVLVLAGAALVVTTFTRSMPVACLGLLLMGAGLWRLLVVKADIILGRLTAARRAQAPAPSPPRTPPAAV
jgi:hypothetical protein